MNFQLPPVLTLFLSLSLCFGPQAQAYFGDPVDKARENASLRLGDGATHSLSVDPSGQSVLVSAANGSRLLQTFDRATNVVNKIAVAGAPCDPNLFIKDPAEAADFKTKLIAEQKTARNSNRKIRSRITVATISSGQNSYSVTLSGFGQSRLCSVTQTPNQASGGGQ